MIVADTNLIVYQTVVSDQTPLAERVFDSDPDWHAPLLWRSEFRSALASYLRAGRMTYERALEIMDEAEGLMFNKGNHLVDSTAVMQLVSQSTCSAYDCEFVALAQQLDVSLVTTDRRILREFPNVAVAPVEFVG